MVDMDFRPVIWFLVACGAIGVLVIFGLHHLLFSTDEIKVKHRLDPIRYELTVTDNKIDTVFIYKKP